MDHLGATYLTTCGLQAEKIEDSTRKAFPKWEKTQPEGVYGTGGACLPKQPISQINPLEKFPLLNSILGMVTTLSIYLFHIFWRQTKPLCVGKLGRNGKNDETFTLKQKGNNPIVRTSNTSLHAWNQA